MGQMGQVLSGESRPFLKQDVVLLNFFGEITWKHR
jgi:hypothetical protein